MLGFGTASLFINAAADSNTTITFAQYQLFAVFGINLTGGSTSVNTTITFADAVTGGIRLDALVDIWVFSAADDTFSLGGFAQNVDVSSGGADTVILDIGVIYQGNFVGGDADDRLRFATSSSIGAVNGGAATGFGLADFSDTDLYEVMTVEQHNGFKQLFAGTKGTQSIELTNSGTATGDGGIEQYFLAGGDDTFTVAADNGAFTQGVDVVLGGSDIIVYGAGTFTGGLVGATDDTVQFTGNADVSGVNGGGTLSQGFADFSNAAISVTMTLAQHIQFSTPFQNTGGTQTITLTGAGAVAGDAGIESYILTGGTFLFTVATGLPSQNVDLTGALGGDFVIFDAAAYTGNLTGAESSDTVQFTANADISGVNSGKATGAGIANFNDANLEVSLTLEQHNGFAQPFQQTNDSQLIWLTTSGKAAGDAGIESYILADGDDVFTLAKDSGPFNQSINLFKGGNDTVVFGNGTFTGFFTNGDAGDTVKFTGDADISGVNGGNPTTAGKASFSDTDISVTMTLDQHNGFTQPFGGTNGVQTIELTTSGTATGDVGIEDYLLAGNDDNFFVAKDNGAFKQDVDVKSGGNDTLSYLAGTYSGEITGCDGVDLVSFLGDVDISGVNNGEATGAGNASFNDLGITVMMTAAQHNDFGTPFQSTGGVQTIVLATAGVVTGDIGIENYVAIGDGDYTFTFAADNNDLVGGSQNLDLVDSAVYNDTIVFAGGTFSGALKHAGKGDTVLFTDGVADISKLNGGAATGAEFVSFADGGMSATMTVAQHNAFQTPFKDAGAIQTITLTTDGAVTGDIGIEQYILGEDGTNKNVFMVGLISQSVTGRGDNDTVINNFGGLSGVLKGGGNTATGDTLILGAANTTLAVGSGEFENLTLTATNATVTSDLAAHNGFTGVINTLGTNNYTVNDDAGGELTGLFGFESYAFVSGTGIGFDFTLTNAQTGTITGIGACDDMFIATAAQVAGAALIDGGGQTASDTLTITTDAGGLDLGTKTKGIETYILTAGSTSNVFGANGDFVLILATGSTIFTMGSIGENQTYAGGVGVTTGIDRVTFNVGSTSVATGDQNDTVTSLVGDGLTGVLDGGGGFDTLELTNDDSLVDGTVVGFENLVLANNALVLMNATQANQFTTNSAAPGVNTITIAPGPGGVGFTGKTFADVENYVLLGGTNNHTYTIAGSNQTVTDLDTNGGNVANILGGLTNVTVAARTFVDVFDVGGGTNHSFSSTSDSAIRLAGGQFGVTVTTGAGKDFVQVIGGIVTGSFDGGAGGFDRIVLSNTADVRGATFSGYETLDVSNGASVTMNGATWDQFVGIDGKATPGHTVGGGGFVTATLTSTTSAITTAYTHDPVDPFFAIDSYVLSSTANDFFRVNNDTTTVLHFSVDLSGGGSDFVVLNDTNAGAFDGSDVHTTLTHFGSGVGGDVVQLQKGGNSVSSGAFQLIAAANSDVTAGNTTIVINSGVTLMDATWDLADAQAALDAGIDMIAAGTYTAAIYFAGAGQSGAYLMGFTTAANDPGNAQVDLIGVLSSVFVNTLTSNNFT